MFQLLGAWKGKSKYFGDTLECKDFLVYRSVFPESKEGCQSQENWACLSTNWVLFLFQSLHSCNRVYVATGDSIVFHTQEKLIDSVACLVQFGDRDSLLNYTLLSLLWTVYQISLHFGLRVSLCIVTFLARILLSQFSQNPPLCISDHPQYLIWLLTFHHLPGGVWFSTGLLASWVQCAWNYTHPHSHMTTCSLVCYLLFM